MPLTSELNLTRQREALWVSPAAFVSVVTSERLSVP